MSAAQITFDRSAERARVAAERRRLAIIDLVITLATIALALVIGFLVMLLVGKDPVKAYEALLTGPLSRTLRTGRWLEDATTLIILGLSVSIAFRARQFSLGAESQMYVGALVAAVIAIYVPMPPVVGIIVPLVAGMAAGFLIGLIPGLMKAYLNANEIVSTLMINAVIFRLYDYLLTYVFTAPGAQQIRSDAVQANSTLIRLGDIFKISFGRVNLGVIFCGGGRGGSMDFADSHAVWL